MKYRRYIKIMLFFILYLFLLEESVFSLNSIAVSPFKNNEEISIILTKEISQFKNLEVVTQEEVQNKIKIVKIQKDDLIEPLRILDLGRILNVNIIVFGAYNEIGDNIKISTQVLDVYSKEIKHIYQITGAKSEIKNIIHRMGYLLFNPENYNRPEKEYIKLKKEQNIDSKIIVKNDSFVPDSTIETVPVNEITFKNFITFRTNFVPFFWLDNNFEVIGTLLEKNGQNIVIFNANIGEVNIIQGTFSPYYIKSISMSPDKKKIAFESNGDIYVLNLDGSNRRKVDFGFYPSWSPDSRKIAYIKGTPTRVYYTSVEEIREPTELEKGSTTAWFPGGKEIVINYNFNENPPYLTLVIIDSKVTHELKGEDAMDYYFLLASNNFSGPHIPMFVKRNWIIRKASNTQLEIFDFNNRNKEIIKFKGKIFEVKALNIAWSKDGKKIIYMDDSQKNMVTVAEFGFKEKVYLKLNVGARDGLERGNQLDVVNIETRESPKTGEIYRYEEKIVGNVSIGRVYPRISIAYIPANEIDLNSNTVVKYVLSNGAEIEGSILSYENDIISFLNDSTTKASVLFESANKLFDAGEFKKCNELLKKIIDIYPETQYYKNAKDMMKILPNKRIEDE
ncbi:MAG: PD40 domain-containing protein [Candidatus Firestonebacteria bacterium]|nr:PD40 domain-containing protein [Candidatus Firestonebacteria bacterium]